MADRQTMTPERQRYWQGFGAYRDNLQKECNPFSYEQDVERENWLAGWIDGRIEERTGGGMNGNKPWWKSKTLWLAAVMLAAAGLEMWAHLTPQPQVSAGLVAFSGGLMAVMRTVSYGGVSFPRPSPWAGRN